MHFFFFFISLCFYFKFFGKDATNDANMSKTYFWVFLLFFAIFGFFKKKLYQKLDNNICLPLYNAYKTKPHQ